MPQRFGEDELFILADKIKEYGLFEKIDYELLSKKLGMSQKKLKLAINEMMENEIAKMSVSVNFKKLPVVIARVAIKSKKAQYNKKIFEILKSADYLDSATYVGGSNYSHIISLVVPSIEKLCEVTNDNMGKLSGLIDNTNTMIVRNVILFENYKYSFDKEKKVDIDEYDWKILHELREDATKSLSEIGKSVGLQAPSIHRRIKILKKSGIINGYYCKRFISQKPSELTNIGCFMGLMNNGNAKKWNTFLNKIMSDKTCWKSHMAFVFGEFDLSFNLWADTPTKIREFIEKIIEDDESVLKIETAMILDHYKGNFTKSFIK